MKHLTELMGLAYVGTAVILASQLFSAKRPLDPLTRKVSLCASITLVVLAALKVLGAAPLLVAGLREFAVESGWYEYHQAYQIAAILIVVVAGASVAAWLFARAHAGDKCALWAGSSLFLLLLWVATRASSLHVADRFMGINVGPFTVHQIGEFVCLLCLAASAFCPIAWNKNKSVRTVSRLPSK